MCDIRVMNAVKDRKRSRRDVFKASAPVHVAARGLRPDSASGTAARFAPGQTREVQLVPCVGARVVHDFNQTVMGP